MCGIAGMFGAPDRETVAAMIAAIRHRGPDGDGLMADAVAAFGHLRLSIIDLSAAANQPMTAANGAIWITYNGEIYNFKEHRARLDAEGWPLRTTSDTEVILALYERHGDDFLRRLRGIFALAIYDKRRGPGQERLLLARDQMGIKPLLYAVRESGRGRRIVFASEIKAMVRALDDAAIDPEALRQVLAWGSVCQPRTILSDVAALPAGHYLVAERGTTRIEPYWQLGIDRVKGLRGRPYGELVDAADEKLGETLAAQLVADVPVGAFLSGGIDSSLLVALMARRHNGAIRTFSVGFENGAGVADETDDAAEVASYLGTDHRRVVVTGTDAAEGLVDFARAIDQPTVDGINSWFISRSVGGAMKVAISGTGGDELFAGYPWYAALQNQEAARADARGPLRSLARRLLGGADGGEFVAGYAAQYYIFGPERARALLADDLRGQARTDGALQDLGPADQLRKGSAIERTTALVLGNYTRNQLLRDIDAASMAHALEVRVPLLDHELADFALSLPDSAKQRPEAGEGSSYDAAGHKRILVDVGRRYLPQGFGARTKRGFALPFQSWLEGPLAPLLADCVSPEVVARRGLFDPAASAQVMEQFRAGQCGWPHPWLLMMVELWCREVLDAAKHRAA